MALIVWSQTKNPRSALGALDLGFLPVKMSTNMRVENRLDGADSFKSWKHKVLLIQEENEFVKIREVGQKITVF
jgi:hypothetical protein